MWMAGATGFAAKSTWHITPRTGVCELRGPMRRTGWGHILCVRRSGCPVVKMREAWVVGWTVPCEGWHVESRHGRPAGDAGLIAAA